MKNGSESDCEFLTNTLKENIKQHTYSDTFGSVKCSTLVRAPMPVSSGKVRIHAKSAKRVVSSPKGES